MQVPTREEINVFDSLDEQAAVRNFHGKSLEEAEALFRENSCCYAEDLMWMGPIAFRYYIMAAIHYICSDAAAGDSSIIAGLAIALEFRLEYEEQELVPVSVPLATICAYIVDHASKFNLGDSYEDIPDRFVALRNKFRTMNT